MPLASTSPLKSFNKITERQKQPLVLRDLENGLKIGLVVDAGTPTISDPGAHLVNACHEKNLQVTHVPGPSAVMSALCLSGLEDQAFQFLGFMPKPAKDIKSALDKAFTYDGITVFFLSPHNLERTLTAIEKENPQAKLALAKELTKKFEQIFQGTASDIRSNLPDPIRGEYVLLIQNEAQEASPLDLPAKKLFEMLISDEYGLKKTKAAKVVQKLYGVKKNFIYTDK